MDERTITHGRENELIDAEKNKGNAPSANEETKTHTSGRQTGQEAERMETGIGGAESGGPEGWRDDRGGSRRSKVRWERGGGLEAVGCTKEEVYTEMSAEETKPRFCEELGRVMTGRIRLGAAWQRHNAAGHFVVQNRMTPNGQRRDKLQERRETKDEM
ncbi:hypothetical protein I7I51_04698 [Histoplasma capsulatum]|uniref:Uncharacterized protein n=1 Tax=Ajellomyces capsulatus TaxID=5037 RepID=A0A8A1M615_AJECA|nr:hypothetical protein I7I51_04698 [Histoplasma capsulatum]